MSAIAIAAAVGFVTGFVGAIPPGPAGMTVAAHAADGAPRRAIVTGLGAATVDVSLCAAIALGAGPILARVTAPPMVRVFLAAAYAALGVMLVAEALVRRARPKPAGAGGGFFGGVLRGILNPSLVANWTLVIAALLGAGALPSGRAAGAAFAIGVGLGVASWFSTLAHVVHRARGERLAPWLRRASAATGALLVAMGGLGALRALAG